MISVESGLHNLFASQASRSPDAAAIVFPDGQTSYGELDRETDALGAYLRQCGVAIDDPVGIFMETCREYIVATIATLKAGGAFMPVPLDTPDHLLRAMLSESRPKVVLTTSQHLPRLGQATQARVLAMDSDRSWARLDSGKHSARVADEDMVFLPYTSGTTGDPKGVMLTSEAVISSYLARYEFSSYGVGDRVACNIFFAWEFLRPLLKGGTVYVVPDDVVFVPRALARFISEHRISEILFTPSLLQGVLNSSGRDRLRERLSSLRVVWLNGEVVPVSLLRQALDVLPDSARIFNTYSISETHDVCTVDLTDLCVDGMDSCPVGFAMDGVKVMVRPEGESALVSEGVGELMIGGRGLARGYLGRPDLDARSFISWNGERYYATGDLAEVAEDGMVTIVGRTDSMVKIRGYSVYLGAIEETLRRHCDVADAAVVAEPVDETSKRLVAYVARGPQAAWKVDAKSGTSRELRALLERYLPVYSVPTHFMEMESLPINQQTGKLERKALPPLRRVGPALGVRNALADRATAAGRRNVLRALWAEALEVDGDSLEDDWDFFDLGGHSLTGLSLTLDIEQTFGIELSGTEIYEHPTVGELAEFLEHRGQNMTTKVTLAEDSTLDPAISPGGDTRTTRLSEASSVFITGTTGFLGAFLLDELLRNTGPDTRFYCLVRDRNDGRGESTNRVLETLKFYGLAGQSEHDRIVPVTGDLTLPQMGLSDDQYRQLSESIDLIFHCAASVNYVYPYSVAKPHTVDGTLEVLKFACSGTPKAMQYISSNGVFPGGDETPYLENSEIDDFVDRMEGGYNQAKWVAERLVWTAVSRGLPVCLYRPGNIGHHSGTGTVNPNDFLSLIMKACARLGSAPDTPDWFFEMTPVDFLASAVAKISDDARNFGRVYNVVQQQPVPASQVFARMKGSGYVSEIVGLEEWKSRLEAAADREDDMEMKLLARSLDSVEGYLADTSAYDISRFSEVLAEIGLAMPAVDAEYVTVFLER